MADEPVAGWKNSVRSSQHRNDHKSSLNQKGRKDRNLDKGKRKRSPSDNRKEKHSSKKIKKKKEKKAKRKKEKRKKKSQIADSPPPRKIIATESVNQPRNFTPMTKEEWDKQQSVIRRVYDPETGRNRLVKGTGEILEEIVSKQQHQKINKQATLGDGFHYQATLMNKLRKN